MIEVRNLSKSYRGQVVLDNVSLCVPPDSIFGILGRNGAGKTTFLECLIGLRRKDEGVVRIMGENVEEDSLIVRRYVGVQPQEASLLQRQTVQETLELFSSFYGHGMQLDRLMERLSLQELKHKQVRALSAGQRQRLMIAVAMVGNPKLLILDEPTSGLDPQVRRSLWRLILEMKEEGKTVVVTTHYMEEAEELCDEVVILNDAHFVAQGTPKELIDKYAKGADGSGKQNLESAFVNLTGTDVRGGLD